MKFEVGDKVQAHTHIPGGEPVIGEPMTVVAITSRTVTTSDGSKWSANGDLWGYASAPWTSRIPSLRKCKEVVK